jgi:RimJ/RimL family protein N-acetyltransferase
MQQSWRSDRDKLTFITSLPLPEEHSGPELKKSDVALGNLVGDINLFLTLDEDTEELVGEVELMIARKEVQGKGFGRASLLAFLRFLALAEERICREFYGEDGGVNEMNESGKGERLGYLRAKIREQNQRSIGLFESVGFVQHRGSNYFGEVELRWRMPPVEGIEGWSLQNGLGSWEQLVYIEE